MVARSLMASEITVEPAAETRKDEGATDFSTTPFIWYLRFTPLLWMLGALIPCAVVLLVKLAAERWPRGKIINLVVLCWILIAVAQASSAVLNGLMLHDPALGLRNAASFTVIGWLFGALAIAIGNSWELSSQRAARYIARLGLYILLLSIVALAGVLAGRTEMRMLTPIGMALPGGNATNFYASMTLFQSEDTLGESRIRLILFFPWATALGLGGLAIAVISSRVVKTWPRIFGMAGGATGVIFSWSRIAVAAMILVAAILIFLKLPRFLQITATVAVAVGLYAASVMGFDPVTVLMDIHDAADRARAGSSLARDLIYEKSWEGFLRSPVIGNGWIGESVHRVENLPIGSHSTVFGLLYTGGTITFGCFVLAMLVTLFALLYALYHWRGDAVRRQNAIVGCCLWLSLALYCPYEALFSITLSCVFLFTWIGGVIPGARDGVASAEAGLRKKIPVPDPRVHDAPHRRAFAVAGSSSRPTGLRGRRSSVFTHCEFQPGEKNGAAN
jgi:hypothetical protein